MEATINSIQSKPEETLTSQADDILLCVNQLHMASEEMSVRTDGTQLGLLESLDKCTRSLHEKIEDTTKDLHKD
jgi:hypothetical protein